MMKTTLGKAMDKEMGGKKMKSKRQVGMLMSKNSPLSPKQKKKLKGELHGGKVSVR